MFDLAITGGFVIDPLENRLITANVYVKDDKIAEISRVLHEAKELIDATGMYVSPGFIDMHTHTENQYKVGEMLVRQGVTTVTGGHCGIGQTDLLGFFAEAEKGFIVNQSQLVGASELRERAGQKDPLAPMTKEQIQFAEKALLADLEAGAAGLSFGLAYVPGSSDEEITRLAQIAARYGKIVTIHTRGNGWEALLGVQEAIDISRRTGAPVHISHVVYEHGFGGMKEALDLIDEAVHEGLDISCDSGMYTSFATNIGSEVFTEEALKALKCPLEKIFMGSGKYAGQPISSYEMFLEVREKFPHDIANAMVGCPHEIPMAFELPYMMCSSDAGVSGIGGEDEPVHPQDAASFAKFLRETVVTTRQLTLVDAVSRITSLPAKRMGFETKGRLVPGADADIVVFDIDRVHERADFPHLGKADAPPDGFEAVIVNGKVVVRKGNVECKNAGKVLRAPNALWKY